jgi:ATP10 protein
MKKAIALLYLFSGLAYGQRDFPALSGETLSGESIEVPADLMGKKSIIGLAYSKKADEDLRTWFEPAYTKFIDPPKVSFLPEDPFEGNIYFIPMLQGLAKTVGGKIEKELKKGIDPKLHKYILMFRGSVKEYKDELEMTSSSTPYFFVLDEQGKILYKTDGPYSDEKLEEIESYLE